MASTNALTLATSFSGSKLALPTPACTIPPSRPGTALAALGRLDRLAHVGRHRAELGVRHQAARPEYAAERPTSGIMSGWRCSGRSRSGRLHLLRQILGPDHVGAGALASSALSPLANTATRRVLPVPCGRLTVPRTIWSAWRGSTPSERELDGLVELGLGVGLDHLHGVGHRWSLPRSIVASSGLEPLALLPSSLLRHLEAH